MRGVYLLSISLFPLMISTGMIYSVLPIYLSENLGAEEIQVGMLFTTGAATGAISSIFLGRIADRVGRKPLVISSQLLFATAMVLYSSISTYIHAFPIHIIEGFGWAMVSISAPALIADIAGREKRGEAMGVYNTVWNLGWVIGPFLGGALAQFYGFKIALRVSFAMIVFGAILTSLLVEERGRKGRVQEKQKSESEN